MEASYPSDLSDAEWAVLRKFVPKVRSRGRPRAFGPGSHEGRVGQLVALFDGHLRISLSGPRTPTEYMPVT